MTNPTPEEMRLVAEYVGHKFYQQNNTLCNILIDGEWHIYNPLTNAEQSMELLKMLLRNGWVAGTEEGENAEFTFMRNQLWIYDESLELAVFNAALAHIKGSTKTEGEG